MKFDLILARYGELFLKSEPVRRAFEKKLIENMRAGLKGRGVIFQIASQRGRIFVSTEQIKAACQVLQKVFGLVSISPCWHLATSEMAQIRAFCQQNYSRWIGPRQTFAVRVSRVGKQPYTSHELAQAIGDVINRQVDLTHPDVELFVEVRDNDTYVYTQKFPCPGGLPIGVTGKVVCLISGGIDSPVAAWQMMKRGCQIIALYADNTPYTDVSTTKRFFQVMRVLSDWSVGARLQIYTFAHGPNLEHFVRHAPRKLTCILCKRMMYRMANELAKKSGAMAIVTGEGLAQVASQTLDNLAILDQASDLPVFRPLIGNDKEENVRLARQIGTYESSCMPVMTCRAVPRRPATRAKLDQIIHLEQMLGMNGLLKRSLSTLATR